MEEKPFRVLLDFSEVNTGISGLKYVWMHVSPRELNTIYDFKQAIIRKFSFTQDGFKLFVRDGLLLETEKIAILREDDTVKIQLEPLIETSGECNVISTGIDIPVAQTPSLSLTSSAVSLSKSRKRKSETYINTSRDSENDSLSTNVSKKKQKQDKTECTSDQSTSMSKIEELSISESQDVSSLVKNPISYSSNNNENNNKPLPKSKKTFYHKTPTSEFITLAVKLSEADKRSQNVSQSDVKIANTKRISQSISDTNLYKTAETVSKTYLSPIPEKSTFELSSSQTPLNLTESYGNSETQVDGSSSIYDEALDGKDGGKKKRRRKRKRKVIQSPENSCLSADVNAEMDGSFLAEIKSNETYHASPDTRKHIFHSPTSPPKTSTTITLVSNPNSSADEPKELSIGNNNLKSDSGLDSSRNHSLQEDSQLVISEIGDYTKESTPFSKKKLKAKSWGVTPLPRSSSSNTITMDNSDVSRSGGVKPAYHDCTPLNCLPPVGTRLAYKTLELNEDYCPEVTEYKEGILRKVDPNTDELEIELVQEEIKPGRSGKFENLWKDEPLPDNQVVKTVSLNWSALIEPRLIP